MKKYPVLVFVILTFLIAWSCDLLAIRAGLNFEHLDDSLGRVWAMLVGVAFAPGIAGIVAGRWYYGNFKWLRITSIGFSFLPCALLPIMYISASYILLWHVHPGSFDSTLLLAGSNIHSGHARLDVLIAAISVLFTYLLPISFFALGEEIGWSAFLVPILLERYGYVRASLANGLVWSVYHYPLVLFSNPIPGVPGYVAITGQTITLTAMSFILVLLRSRSGSIWPVVIMHAIHNILLFNIFEPLTKKGHLTAYLVGESGIFIAATVAIVAVLFKVVQRSSPTGFTGAQE